MGYLIFLRTHVSGGVFVNRWGCIYIHTRDIINNDWSGCSRQFICTEKETYPVNYLPSAALYRRSEPEGALAFGRRRPSHTSGRVAVVDLWRWRSCCGGWRNCKVQFVGPEVKVLIECRRHCAKDCQRHGGGESLVSFEISGR